MRCRRGRPGIEIPAKGGCGHHEVGLRRLPKQEPAHTVSTSMVFGHEIAPLSMVPAIAKRSGGTMERGVGGEVNAHRHSLTQPCPRTYPIRLLLGVLDR